MTQHVIGNGSLLWTPSLHRTCPHARILQPVRVDGWRRVWTLPIAPGDPAPTVINAHPADDAWFNGVVIAVPDDEYDALCAREHQYRPVDVTWCGWSSDDTGTAALWSSTNPAAMPDWDHPHQERYAGICLRGCAEHDPGTDGAAFRDAFLATTFVGDESLMQLRQTIGQLRTWTDNPPTVRDP